MSKLVRDLKALGRALQKGVVTTTEAAERLHLLADRVPSAVVLIEASGGQGSLVCYLASGDEEQVIAEVERALGVDDLSDYDVRVAAARQGLVRLWSAIPQEETGAHCIGAS